MQENHFIDSLFERARRAGFGACEVYISHGDNFQAAVNKGEITRYCVSDSLNLGFRGLYKGRMGAATTQAMDENALDMLIQAAREGAELLSMDEGEEIFSGSGAYPPFEGRKPRIAELYAGEKLNMLRALEEAALSVDGRIESVSHCALASTGLRRRIVNSLGLDLHYENQLLRMSVCPVARQGDKTGTAGRALFITDPKKSDLAAMAREAAQEALCNMDAGSVASGQYPILLRQDVAAALLSAFSGLFSADAARKGLSPLKGREGERIAAPCVQIMDDPLLENGVASRPFDGEGVAARRVDVVTDGKLNTLLHNLKTARLMGASTTGSAARLSAAGPMTVAPSNLFIRPGEKGLEDLCRMAGRGIMITDLMGLHSGVNGTSGDFSLGAKGVFVENGRPTRGVKQITIAGNILNVLREMEAVGADLRHDMGSISSPSLYLRGLSVAGAGD